MSGAKFLCMFVILAAGLIVSGCTVRMYKQTKDRIDQEIIGNRGYLAGEAPTIEGQPRSSTRETVVVEVELGPQARARKPQAKKAEAEKVVSEPAQVKDVLLEELEPKQAEEQTETFQTYKVMKDDTLQKISKKFYGTYKKWKKIYDANKEKIKDPDRIKPGIVLNIPQ